MMTTKPACDEHEDHDGCLCHAPVTAIEATRDRDLPEAQGGVEGDIKPRARRKGDRTSVQGEA
jgi:hypothetical protein